MALLKYICNECSHVFEELVTGGKQTPCPRCGSKNIKRHYCGKCYFGQKGSSKGSGGLCTGGCASCSGCRPPQS